MSSEKTPLFVRLPKQQVAALDRLADKTGRPKQHLLSEFLADRLASGALSVGRVELTNPPNVAADDARSQSSSVIGTPARRRVSRAMWAWSA